jgi:hypothetical protein
MDNDICLSANKLNLKIVILETMTTLNSNTHTCSIGIGCINENLKIAFKNDIAEAGHSVPHPHSLRGHEMKKTEGKHSLRRNLGQRALILWIWLLQC